MSLFSFISISNIICLIKTILGMPSKEISFGKKGNKFYAQYLTKLSLEMYLNECLIYSWQRLWFVHFFLFFLFAFAILVVFYSITKPAKSIMT